MGIYSTENTLSTSTESIMACDSGLVMELRVWRLSAYDLAVLVDEYQTLMAQGWAPSPEIPTVTL